MIGDSPRAARYAGMRTRRKIVARDGALGRDRRASAARARSATSATCSTPRGLQQASYGYTGIVVAALARYNPFAVVLVAFLLGGLQNAGYTLQGADFPSGPRRRDAGADPVRVLGGELLVRTGSRSRARRRRRARPRRGRPP